MFYLKNDCFLQPALFYFIYNFEQLIYDLNISCTFFPAAFGAIATFDSFL